MTSLRSDVLPEALIVASTGCLSDANSSAVSLEMVSNAQAEDPWDIAPYRYAVDTIDRLKTFITFL